MSQFSSKYCQKNVYKLSKSIFCGANGGFFLRLAAIVKDCWVCLKTSGAVWILSTLGSLAVSSAAHSRQSLGEVGQVR